MTGRGQKTLHAQALPRTVPSKNQYEDILAEFCYRYQAYTYSMARSVPYKRIVKMIRLARRMESAKYHNLVQIIAAPHSKKGENVKKLLDHYKDISNG